MSPKEKEQLERMKMFTVTEGTPKDLTKAIQTFIKQAVIVGEYELDSMPPEYLQNLLDTMSKFNQDKPLYDKHGCREDEVYWCEGHDRRNADCMCIERTVMENRLQQLRRM